METTDPEATFWETILPLVSKMSRETWVMKPFVEESDKKRLLSRFFRQDGIPRHPQTNEPVTKRDVELVLIGLL